jgi:predicted AlkP superfamily phosphohydrolase/phosphomutase
LGCTQQKEQVVNQQSDSKPTKVYWFIPDGMRTESELFKLYEWANEGKLPNIKKLMDSGSYGYAIPTFPSHTPANFATILTGTYPKTNGVADGPMHIEGYPLQAPSVAGFSSVARKVPAIWSILAEQGKSVAILSIPGSTPPELTKNAITIRGRWGGWGADFASIVFERKTPGQREKIARGVKLFFLGTELTKFVEPTSEDWPYKLNVYGTNFYTKLDKNNMLFTLDKNSSIISLKQGEWSEWIPFTLKWKDKNVDSHIKLYPILVSDDFFRLRVVVDNMNKYITYPEEVASTLDTAIGPMVDFVDNFPPQLVYYPEDKQAFLDEMNLSLDWHAKAVDAIYTEYNPDVFIHDTYNPNQMLTSRWWMGYVDPQSRRYDQVTNEDRNQLWIEVFDMYKKLDDIIGRAIANSDENTLIVISSDHGAAPLDKWVRLNNLFAEKGWIKYSIDKNTGEPIIDWKNSKVVYLKMDNIYINPNGLDGNWIRGKGEEYDKLRDEVIKTLEELSHPNGDKVLAAVVKWENVEDYLDLPKDRVGDLVVANNPGYGFNEEITPDQNIFDENPLESGYKQALFAKDNKSLWTPFIISGKGIKKNFQMPSPINLVDQVPTILTALGYTPPEYIEGRTVGEVFENKN